MFSRPGFSLVEMLVTTVLAVFVLCFALISSGCGGGEDAAPGGATKEVLESQRKVNSIQLRGIHQGMVIFAQGNRDFYPGMDSTGKDIGATPAGATKYGAAAPTANDQSATLAILMSNGYFANDYLVSPLEAKDSPVKVAGAVTGSVTITQNHYSYALLQWAGDGNKGRREEWKGTTNSQAPIASDRSKAIDPNLKTTSVHGGSGADSKAWKGDVVWNDNHTSFEDGIFKAERLKFGQTPNASDDDLFIATGDGDAKMTYR